MDGMGNSSERSRSCTCNGQFEGVASNGGCTWLAAVLSLALLRPHRGNPFSRYSAIGAALAAFFSYAKAEAS